MLTVMSASQASDSLPESTVTLRQILSKNPESVAFKDTMNVIAEAFDYTPKR